MKEADISKEEKKKVDELFRSKEATHRKISNYFQDIAKKRGGAEECTLFEVER